jgi:formylmethanofuran dehydrogenase subunit B
VDAVLVAGSPHSVPVAVASQLAGLDCVAVGPRATESPFPTRVAVDTAVAGIHEGGTAVRLDDVPLPLRPPLGGPPRAVDVLRDLGGRLARAREAPP